MLAQPCYCPLAWTPPQWPPLPHLLGHIQGTDKRKSIPPQMLRCSLDLGYQSGSTWVERTRPSPQGTPQEIWGSKIHFFPWEPMSLLLCDPPSPFQSVYTSGLVWSLGTLLWRKGRGFCMEMASGITRCTRDAPCHWRQCTKPYKTSKDNDPQILGPWFLAGPSHSEASPANPVENTLLDTVTLSSGTLAQSPVARQPFIGKLMSVAPLAGSLWMLSTKGGGRSTQTEHHSPGMAVSWDPGSRPWCKRMVQVS